MEMKQSAQLQERYVSIRGTRLTISPCPLYLPLACPLAGFNERDISSALDDLVSRGEVSEEEARGFGTVLKGALKVGAAFGQGLIGH